VVSRTVGLPFGPEALRSETFSAPDIVSSVIEGVLIIISIIALVFPAAVERESKDRVSLRFAAFAIGTVAVVLGALMLTPTYTAAHEAAGHSHGATATLEGTTPCELSGPPASPGQVATDAEGHSHRGPTPQVVIRQSEREHLIAQQELARTVVTKCPTVAVAEAAGYRMSTPYVPCIGAHYTNMRLAIGFDPARPSELLFDGTAPNSKLVGLSYLVWHPGGAPEGFAGSNDPWHQHNNNGGLCQKNGVVVGAEAMSEDECKAIGGRKIALDDVWMLHDWIVPGWECSWGVFAGECPELGGRTGGTAWDEPAPGSVGAQLAASK
jgi:fumarate reductase subunit D